MFLEKLERLRAFVMETACYHLIFMSFCGFVFFVFVFIPVDFFLDGFVSQFLVYLAKGGMWAFLFFHLVFLFLIAVLTLLKMLLEGFTREEAEDLIYVVVLFLGNAIFFVLFTNGLFAWFS